MKVPKQATTGMRNERFGVKRDAATGELVAGQLRDKPGRGLVTIGKARLEAVLKAAGTRGLLSAKTGRISGRVSPVLVARVKQATGLATDTALIEFALANVALEDGFREALVAARGTVDPNFELGL